MVALFCPKINKRTLLLHSFAPPKQSLSDGNRRHNRLPLPPAAVACLAIAARGRAIGGACAARPRWAC
jgi:hypothetical protein